MKNSKLRRYLICLTMFAGSLTSGVTVSQATVADGVYAYQLGDYARAHAEWLPYAALGNENALYNLGQLYRMGRGVPLDYAKAESYYHRAAERGHVGAQRNLGTLYYFGRLGEVNYTQAFHWLQKAAVSGDPKSQLMVGTMYYNGESIPQNPVQAYAWISLAAERGLGNAKSALQTLKGALTPDQIARADNLAPSLTALQITPDDIGLMVNHAEQEAELAAPQAPQIKTAPPTDETSHKEKADIYRIQLASFRTEDAAGIARSAVTKSTPLPTGVKAVIAFADLEEKGVFYRLQLAPFADRASATAFCDRLKAEGQDCYILKSPNQ